MHTPGVYTVTPHCVHFALSKTRLCQLGPAPPTWCKSQRNFKRSRTHDPNQTMGPAPFKISLAFTSGWRSRSKQPQWYMDKSVNNPPRARGLDNILRFKLKLFIDAFWKHHSLVILHPLLHFICINRWNIKNTHMYHFIMCEMQTKYKPRQSYTVKLLSVISVNFAN